MDNSTDAVIESTDIVSLISKYVPLEKHGKEYRGVCPFHNEKTPSFMVSPEKKIFKCFGCGTGGNAVNFLMKYHNIQYKDALAKIYEFNGLEFKYSTTETKVDSKKKYYDIMRSAIEFYQKNLEFSEEGIIAKEYLHKRGLDDDLIKEFKIGLAPKVGNTLYSVLTELGYLELDIYDVGLIDKNDRGYYDLFSNRIMFPIFDDNENPVAFSSRIYREDIKKSDSKYINSRENVIFKKGELTFNLNKAIPYINKRKRVILHEGQMDVLASYRAGLGEAICTLGTALTESQIKLISKRTKNVVICYDGDQAGIHASLRAIDMFINNGFNVHLCLLPNKMDPDEYIKKFGIDGYTDYFENNIIDPLQYKFETAFIDRNLDDLEMLNEVKNIVFGNILNEKSAILREDYIKKLAQRLNSSYEAVYKDFVLYDQTHATNQGYVIKKPIETRLPGDDKPIPKQINRTIWNDICEPTLIFLAIQNKGLALKIDKEISEFVDGFSKTGQKLWMKLINDYYVNFENFDQGLFAKMLDPKDDGQLFLAVGEYFNKNLANNTNIYNEREIDKCMNKLKIVALKNRVKTSKALLAGDLDNKAKTKLVQQIVNCNKQIETLRKKLK